MNEGNHNWIMCLILMMCISLPTHAKDLPDQPNFVIVLADDISADSFGCFGSPNPHTTPHIDKLAASGIRFKNMFVSEAMCAPARAELYTGLMPQRNGTFRNHKASNPDIKSMVHYLNDLGYRVGLAGKKHIGPGKVYPFENIDGICGKATEVNPNPDDWSGVQNFINRDPEEPFCIVIGSIHAHSPWTVGDTKLWKEEDIVLPPNLVDSPKIRSFYLRYLAEVREFDRQVGETVEVLKKTQQLDHTILIVLDENGAGMPGGKWTVFDWGVRSACVIKCPDSWKANFETDAIAQYCDIVPTLIDAAGGTTSADLDGISLMPLIRGETRTHRDRAYFLFNNRVHPDKPDTHFSIRAVTDGKYKFIWNLTPQNLYSVNITTCDLSGLVRPIDSSQIYPSMIDQMESDPHAQAMVDRIRSRPQHQLYDLTIDPYELNNLAGKPEHVQKVKQFKRDLRKWMKEQGDDGHLNPQGMQVIKYQGYAFPYPKKGKTKGQDIPQKRKI
jgi:uncharacterized sulfatase